MFSGVTGSNEGNDHIVWKKALKENCKDMVGFQKIEEPIELSPVTLSRELKKKIGDVEVVKILRDGQLLLICRTEEQEK